MLFDQQEKIDMDSGRTSLKGYKPPEESENVKKARQGIADALKRMKEKKAKAEKEAIDRQGQEEQEDEQESEENDQWPNFVTTYCPNCGKESFCRKGHVDEETCRKCGHWMDYLLEDE